MSYSKINLGDMAHKHCILSLLCLILLCSVAGHAWGSFVLVRLNQPFCSVVMPEKSSMQERFALEELNYFVEKFTGTKLEDRPDTEPLPDGNVILIGTLDNNRYIDELYGRDMVSWKKRLAEEEFIVRDARGSGRDFLVIVGGGDNGVI